MSAGSVRAGKAFIEITANDTAFQRTLKKTQHSMVRLSSTLKRAGTAMATAGGAMGLPMVLAAQSAATFQDALLELKGAVADISPKQLEDVRAEALRLSKSMGISPAKIAQAFTLLIKAGMDVEEALAGAGKSAVEFAQVSGVEAPQAAEFMKVAMNVFGISAKEAADTLSAAADSSETSIASMIESFALVASVAKGTNQSLFGLSQGLAVLARYGIKGEEAGTGIKTLLVKLLAPTDEAKKALAQLGLSMESLVDNKGKLLPLAQIAEVFAKSMRGMDKSFRNAMLTSEAFVDVFDVRGIRVIHAFAEQGAKGFERVAASMKASRSVAQKFAIAMSGLTGIGHSLMAVIERLAIAFANEQLAGAVRSAANAIIFLIDALSWLFTKVPSLSPILAGVAGVLFSVGAAALGAGAVLQLLNFTLRGFITFSVTATTMSRAFTVSIGGITKALGALRIAMLALPGPGWFAAAAAQIGAVGWWLTSSSIATSNAIEAKNRLPIDGKDIPANEFRRPLGRGGMIAARGGQLGGGESIGTFSSAVLSQLGIGPALTSAEETAANTGRMADGIDELVMNGRVMPNAAALQAGIRDGAPAVAGGVAARSDRDLLSATERTALASEKNTELLRQMLASPAAAMAFT